MVLHKYHNFLYMDKLNSILAVGSIALDSIDTPNGKKNNILGGSATHFSLAASFFTNVKIVGVVGNDFPNKAWKLFESKKINLDNLTISNGKTFRWGGRYNNDYSKRDTIFTHLGVFEHFVPKINSTDLNSKFIFLGNIQPDLQLAVAEQVLSPKLIVTDTMNLWIDLNPKILIKVLKRSNIFLLNDEEAYQFTGEKKPEIAAKQLHKHGPETIIIKMGSKGSYLSSKNISAYIPAFLIDSVIDPTGAGDSFAGGFLGFLSNANNKPNIIDAVITGSAIASFCVEGFGVERLQSITINEINNRKQQIQSNIKVNS